MKKNIHIFTNEQKIINRLIISSSSISDLGLLNGKMGIIIMFFHYARHTGNNYYNQIAEELLDELWEEISNKLFIEFESGLSGIAWGIQYLIQNKFVEGTSSIVCEDINSFIMHIDPLLIDDYSLETRLTGILYYVVFHITISITQNTQPSFKDNYLKALHQSLIKISEEKLTKDMKILIELFNNYYLKKRNLITISI